MRIYSIKPKFQEFLNPVKDLFIKLKISPTAINILALIVSIIGGLLIYYSSFNLWLLISVPFITFIRTALNALDGMVARQIKAKNQKWGEVMNESIDRFSDVAFFLGLAFTSYVNPILGLSTLVAILVVSYLGIIGKSAGGSRQYVGLMGKADRMFWLSFGSVAVLVFNSTNLMNATLVFILFFSVITSFMRFYAIKKELYVPEKKGKKR